MLAPLGKVAGYKKKWVVEVSVYTLAGCVTSMFVGAALGWMGRLLFPGPVGKLGLFFAITIAGIAIARELRWISFPLPQLKRQTKDFWGKVFPGTVAAMFWGLDLGLIFSTRLTFSGIWVLAAAVILVGEPAFGAALFVTYWLGRVLSVWLAPLLMPNANATPVLMDGIYRQYRLFQRIHVLGLGWLIIVFITWFIR